MRKLFSLMLVVLGAAALVSCSKDDDVLREGEGEITFVTEMEGCLYIETFNAGDRITIDWGDGSKKEYVSERDGFEDITEIEFIYGIYPYHTYAGKSSHRVTVKGKIKGVVFYDVDITSIDVTKCPALEKLYCSCYQSTSLDVSKCPELVYLDCSDNQLTSLNISGCTALEYLNCDDNQLTSLDVSKNTALEFLVCESNQLTSLDVSGCTALHRLDCYGNQFSASAMNKIYNDLPVVNNGDLRCDKLGDYSIAENKGWDVYVY